MSVPGDEALRRLLLEVRTVAVVGLSPDPGRPSHGVARYLQDAGYRVVPVRPGVAELLGEPCFPSLLEVPVKVDLVDVFRRSEHVPELARQAVRIGARALWLQEGVREDAAAAEAEAAGLLVVQDRCILKEHRRLLA